MLKISKHTIKNKKLLLFLAISAPVLLYGYGLLRTGKLLLPGDGDYYIQLYEASRISLFEYGQLPWWNPWVSGGIPLFANPQFGPVSIQMFFSLIFGSVFGYKLALVTYLLIGFWGLRTLSLRFFSSDPLKATLTSYIWIFSTFFTYRIAGHFTFFVVGFTPWMIYFLLTLEKKRSWIGLAFFSSAIIWSSMHYTTILSFVILGFVFLWKFLICLGQLWSQKKKIKTTKDRILFLAKNLYIKNLALAAIVTLIICLPRIYLTMAYSHDYPRTLNNVKEGSIGVDNTFYALFGTNQFSSPPINGDWGWHEISTYIGVLMFPVFVFSFYSFLKDRKQRKDSRGWLILGLISICLVVSLGDFASWAPFSIMRELPFFSSMRVATRWINWASIFILIFIAFVKIKNKKMSYLITTALVVTTVELFITGYPRLNDTYIIPYTKIREDSAPFTQNIYWNNKRFGVPYDENFTEATMNNVGQIYAGDSLIDTRPNAGALPIIRCDERTPDCYFVKGNATIEYWSPNKIVLNRTGSGDIELNINPGSGWTVNGKSDPSLKVVEPSKKFLVNDESEKIIIEYKPDFNVFSALINKLK